MTKLLAEKARTLSIQDKAEREKQNKLMKFVFDIANELATDYEYNRVVNWINRCAKAKQTHCIFDIFLKMLFQCNDKINSNIAAIFGPDFENHPDKYTTVVDKDSVYISIIYQIGCIFAERLHKEGFFVNLDNKEDDRVIMLIWWK